MTLMETPTCSSWPLRRAALRLRRSRARRNASLRWSLRPTMRLQQAGALTNALPGGAATSTKFDPRTAMPSPSPRRTWTFEQRQLDFFGSAMASSRSLWVTRRPHRRRIPRTAWGRCSTPAPASAAT